jgi:hypothetical protein
LGKHREAALHRNKKGILKRNQPYNSIKVIEIYKTFVIFEQLIQVDFSDAIFVLTKWQTKAVTKHFGEMFNAHN